MVLRPEGTLHNERFSFSVELMQPQENITAQQAFPKADLQFYLCPFNCFVCKHRHDNIRFATSVPPFQLERCQVLSV